jgi:hypothetical protein
MCVVIDKVTTKSTIMLINRLIGKRNNKKLINPNKGKKGEKSYINS